MLFAMVAAVAQTSPAAGAGGGGKFRAACGEDVQRLCVGVQAGGDRLVQCLSSHTSELSAAWKYDRGNTGSQRYLQCKRAKVLPHNPLRLPQSITHTCNNRNHRAGRMCKGFVLGAKGKRGLEVPGLSAHGTIDNLQHVFPEIGRAADRPGEFSE
jgi:hypothetical protein